ncbi:MAG: hypothetical protein FWF96_01305, partial [Kiritimatiellaeota bacterium]|nr:hypothetical protein [Kiritimatiellota bacterium]
MKEFKEPGVSLLRRDRLAAGLVGLVAFAVYAATLSPGLYVGESMWSSAQALGYVPALSPANALQFGVAGVCMRFLHFTLGANIHWFGALCGALCAALLFRLAAFFTHQVIHEEHCLRKDRPISLVAGLGTSLVFAFSPGGWVAATRFTIHLVDLLMLLAVLHLFVLYARRPLFATLAALAALYGAGVAQSAYFAMFAPLVALGCVLALWRDDSLSLVRAAWLASAFLAGLALSYAATALVFAAVRDTAAAGEATAWELVKQMIQHGAATIQSLLPEKAWIWLLLTAPAPWMISLFIAGRTLNNERLWSHYLVHGAMTLASATALLGMAHSPWQVYQPKSPAQSLFYSFPLFAHALLAVTTGYLLAYWWLLMNVLRGERSVVDQRSPVFLFGRPLGMIFFCALAVFVACSSASNYVREFMRPKDASLAAVAEAVLDRLEGREWIITDGRMDDFLRHAAARRGMRQLEIINTSDERNPHAIQRIKKAVAPHLGEANRQILLNTLDVGIMPFLLDWHKREPGFIRQNVANWTFPDLMFNTGAKPIPEFLFFGSGLAWKGKKEPDLIGEFRAFIDEMDALLPFAERPADAVDFMRNDLRRHMGFVANNFGVMLADFAPAGEEEPAEAGRRKQEDDAFDFFTRLWEYDPKNASVM